MKQTGKTLIVSLRTTPQLAQRATELARQRGIGRSRLFVRLMEQELALAAACGQQPNEQPTKEEIHAQPA